jgi:hypothetical protein
LSIAEKKHFGSAKRSVSAGLMQKVTLEHKRLVEENKRKEL